MKTNYLTFVLCAFLSFSCSKQEDNTSVLQGKWELTMITNGLSLPFSYTQGIVYWTFSSNKLIVKNNILTLGPEQIASGLGTGTYSYEIKIENGLQILYVNSKREGEIKVEEHKLIIDYGSAYDGQTKIFKR